MRSSFPLFGIIAALVFSPALASAETWQANDLLRSNCQQLEAASGPTHEFPNTYYANLIFQCPQGVGALPAGTLMKALESYGKELTYRHARAGQTCNITTANGGMNVLSNPPSPTGWAAPGGDLVISYNAKYACLGGKTARYYEEDLNARDLNARPLLATQPSGYGEYTGYDQVNYTETREGRRIIAHWPEPDRPRTKYYRKRHITKVKAEDEKPPIRTRAALPAKAAPKAVVIEGPKPLAKPIDPAAKKPLPPLPIGR